VIVKLLSYQASLFRWQPFSQTLEDADKDPPEDGMEETVVAFMHLEKADMEEARRASVFRQTLKHLKWIANKRKLRRVVLHSFAHLGGDTAEAGSAQAFLIELKSRLEATSYEVKMTPFGWFCSWELKVYGESIAKVFKEI
jgi:hypothetical protein